MKAKCLSHTFSECCIFGRSSYLHPSGVGMGVGGGRGGDVLRYSSNDKVLCYTRFGVQFYRNGRAARDAGVDHRGSTGSLQSDVSSKTSPKLSKQTTYRTPEEKHLHPNEETQILPLKTTRRFHSHSFTCAFK